MATAGDVVEEDLGRMNPPFGRGGTDGSRLRRWSQDSVGALQPGESFTAVGCRHPGRIRNLDIAKPHSRSQKKGQVVKYLASEFRYQEYLVGP